MIAYSNTPAPLQIHRPHVSDAALREGRTSTTPSGVSPVLEDTVDLTLIDNGTYWGTRHTFTAGKTYLVQKLVYDSGYTTVDDTFPQDNDDIQCVDPAAVMPMSAAKMSASVNPSTDVLTVLAWLEVDGLMDSLSTAVTVTIYDSSSALLFTMTSSSPSSEGFFALTANNASSELAPNQTYLAKVCDGAWVRHAHNPAIFYGVLMVRACSADSILVLLHGTPAVSASLRPPLCRPCLNRFLIGFWACLKS